MKHVFCFFLISILLVSLLFALFCTEFRFESSCFGAKIRAENGLPVLTVFLRRECTRIYRKTKDFLASLPPLLYEPPRLVLDAFCGLLSDARAAYKAGLSDLP